MTYVPQARIELQVAELWRTYDLAPNFDLERLLDDLDLGILWTELQPEVLAEISPYERRVTINERRRSTFDSNQGLYRFTLAHEVGHWYLHAEGPRSGSRVLFEARQVLCRDGDRNDVETQAHRFGGALLAPRDAVRAAMPSASWKGWMPVRRMADHFGLSSTAMFVRLKELGLAHDSVNGVPASGHKTDPNQQSLF